jgi:hypothetical protein
MRRLYPFFADQELVVWGHAYPKNRDDRLNAGKRAAPMPYELHTIVDTLVRLYVDEANPPAGFSQDFGPRGETRRVSE